MTKVLSMCPDCGRAMTVKVGAAVPKHDCYHRRRKAVFSVGFDPAWPPCLCHGLARETPPTWASLRDKPIVLVRKYESGMGSVSYVSDRGGCGGSGFPCSWSVEAVVQALRRLGVNVAADNGRVPATWDIPALGDGKDRIGRCLRNLKAAGVVPRRDMTLEAWM